MLPLRLLLIAAACLASTLHAQSLRALPAGQLPDDIRLQPLKDLDGYFPFTPPSSAEAWQKRALVVRQQMRMALGLPFWPTGRPLNAVIHSRLERGDYTVEKVYFESLPGFFVTGNLYRPVGGGKHPGVLCPYGHWPDGRFFDASPEAVKQEFAMGSEHLENAARSPLQARCVQLARMGCVVFHYDMIGKADSQQIPDEVAHGFKTQRPEMNSPEGWGFFSPLAEGYGQSIMGLQTWDSIRALDFLQSLEDVDRSRIGVTGSSGGATQTMMLAALDPRVTAAFPAVMVSTAMQGGCTCENASGLRVGTGNVEIASLFAPKPMAMTAADDWTKQMSTEGFPEMQKLWALLGAPQNVQLTEGLKFPHNYNAPARAAMYAWFNQHLGLNLPPEQLEERNFPLLSRAEMSVWDPAHPAPVGGPDFERKLLREWLDIIVGVRDFPDKIDAINGAGWQEILRRDLANSGDASWHIAHKSDQGDYWLITGLVRNDTQHEEIPSIFLHPKNWRGATVLWLSEQGKAGLFAGGDARHPIDGVAQLLRSGVSVIGIDLTRQGEALPSGEDPAQAPSVKNPREVPAYTLGYSEPLFVQRAHDVLTLRRLVQTDQHQARAFGIVALDRTAAIAAAARLSFPQDPAALDKTFRFAKISDIRDPYLVPRALLFGDMPGLLSAQSLAGSAARPEEQEGAITALVGALK